VQTPLRAVGAGVARPLAGPGARPGGVDG